MIFPSNLGDKNSRTVCSLTLSWTALKVNFRTWLIPRLLFLPLAQSKQDGLGVDPTERPSAERPLLLCRVILSLRLEHHQCL